MDLKGKLVKQLAIESGTSKAGKDWQKRVNIFEIPSGNYTDSLAVTFFGDHAKSELKIGLEYQLSLNVKSREGNDGRWYTEATIWRWAVVDGVENERQDKAGVSPQFTDKKFDTPSAARNASVNASIPDDSDGLPF